VAPRVLVVDDEPMLRRLVARALSDAGYIVDEASDGLAGWELARSTPDLDLVITDSRMPRLSGPELVRRLRELNPLLPVLQLSGSERRPMVIPTLFKPFDIKDLVQAVRELLASNRAQNNDEIQ
jgi:DNA-binding response OmpR family regulator